MKVAHPVVVENRQSIKVNAAFLRRAAASAGEVRGPLELTVVDDEEIREINREHLGHDWATDVVTFPMESKALWGAIVVSAETARREARDRGVPFRQELALYVVHGVLHLLGHDDHSPAERRRMRAAESAAMARLGMQKKTGKRRGGASLR